MKIKLKRIAFKPTYTIGKLYLNDVFFSNTIEDVNRDLNKDGDLEDTGETKVMHKTCIPFGEYKVIVNISGRFKRYLPRLLNVPSFDGILIHNGVDETSSSGCIIVGKNTTIGKVTQSREYMNLLTDKLLAAQSKNESISIEIV